MKKSLILAGVLFAANTAFASSINIDVDLGGVGNVLEHTNNVYYQAFMDDNGILHKSDMRLREAKNATISGNEVTRDGIDAIFNLVRGTIVPSDPENSSSVNLTSTANPGTTEKAFKPGIQIYSSNNIQIKRGYLFSQEFLKFFNLNVLFEGVKNYSYTIGASLSQEDKIKNATLLLLLDKFNIRSFSMYFDDNVNSEYTNIINGLSALKAMIDDNVKGDSYKTLLKNKIDSIKVLLQTSKAIYDAAKNAKINIKRYRINGNNSIAGMNARQAGLGSPYIEVFPTNATDSHGNHLYAIDRTHVKYVKTGSSYCSQYTNAYCDWSGNCYQTYTDSQGRTCYDPGYIYGDGYNVGQPICFYGDSYWGGSVQQVCNQTKSCTLANKPPANASNAVKRSYAQNCFYNIDVKTTKKAVRNVLSSLNQSYGTMVNNIMANAASGLNVGTGVKDTLKYLTNNIPNLTDIMVSVSQSYAIRDVNALYRKDTDVNMLDFMDDIQEVIGLKQYRYNKDLDVARIYQTAISLSDFSNNSLPKVSQEQLSQQVQDAIQMSNEIADSGDDSTGAPTAGANAADYTPITPTNFVSSSDGNTANSPSTLAAAPSATTDNNAVAPEKMLIIYLNPFDAGAQQIIFGNNQATSAINNYLTTNFDTGTLSNYDVFAYGINKDDGTKYFLGEQYLNDSERLDYLENSFALFGMACTQAGSDSVCTLQDRHVDSEDDWIDIGEDNILHLYNILISKISGAENVNLNPNDLTATLNEITGFVVDSDSGDTAQKLASILNGDQSAQNEAMKVDTFMPFKGEGLLVQSHYEIKHYTIAPVTQEVCDNDGNCTTVTTGYQWKYVDSTYPNYSCNAGFRPTSHVATMFLSKIYGNYVNGQIATTNITYGAIGTTQGGDFAALLGANPNPEATNQNMVVGGTSPISYTYEQIANPNIGYTPSDADCMAHGLQPGCTAQDIGVAVNCSDMGNDDFWNSHAVIETMGNVQVSGVGNSKLVYKNDYAALGDQTKSALIDPDTATIYSFGGLMPGVGDSGFNDTTNVYKMIFINGDWKNTVITDTASVDTGNNNTAGVTLYDCDGTLQTTMCSDSELPSATNNDTEENNENNNTEGE